MFLIAGVDADRPASQQGKGGVVTAGHRRATSSKASSARSQARGVDGAPAMCGFSNLSYCSATHVPRRCGTDAQAAEAAAMLAALAADTQAATAVAYDDSASSESRRTTKPRSLPFSRSSTFNLPDNWPVALADETAAESCVEHAAPPAPRDIPTIISFSSFLPSAADGVAAAAPPSNDFSALPSITAAANDEQHEAIDEPRAACAVERNALLNAHLDYQQLPSGKPFDIQRNGADSTCCAPCPAGFRCPPAAEACEDEASHQLALSQTLDLLQKAQHSGKAPFHIICGSRRSSRYQGSRRTSIASEGCYPTTPRGELVPNLVCSRASLQNAPPRGSVCLHSLRTICIPPKRSAYILICLCRTLRSLQALPPPLPARTGQRTAAAPPKSRCPTTSRSRPCSASPRRPAARSSDIQPPFWANNRVRKAA